MWILSQICLNIATDWNGLRAKALEMFIFGRIFLVFDIKIIFAVRLITKKKGSNQ
jgi:hypothetical protein